MKLSEIDLKALDNVCKVMQKHTLEKIMLHPDGSIEIIKKLHQPKMARKSSSSKKKPTVSDAIPTLDELIGVASRAPKISDFSRYSAKRVLPQED